MARKTKFDKELLAQELYAWGTANKAKGKYFMTKFTNWFDSWRVLNPQPEGSISDQEMVLRLVEKGMPKSRITTKFDDEKGIITLTLKLHNLKLDVKFLRRSGSSPRVFLYYMGATSEEVVCTSSAQLAEMALALDFASEKWFADWEKMLHKGWLRVNSMKKATESINNYLSKRLENTSLSYKFRLGVEKSEVTIQISRNISLSVIVPNNDFEFQTDLLISQALVLDMQFQAMPDEIKLEAQ